LAKTALDIRVATGDDLAFVGQDLQITSSADVRLRGTLTQPRLQGQVAARDRGTVFLAGRFWDIDTATISLADTPRGTETRVDATISARISNYLVEMRVSGPATGPMLTMSSDPPLGQSDLSELVLTGTTGGGFG